MKPRRLQRPTIFSMVTTAGQPSGGRRRGRGDAARAAGSVGRPALSRVRCGHEIQSHRAQQTRAGRPNAAPARATKPPGRAGDVDPRLVARATARGDFGLCLTPCWRHARARPGTTSTTSSHPVSCPIPGDLAPSPRAPGPPRRAARRAGRRLAPWRVAADRAGRERVRGHRSGRSAATRSVTNPPHRGGLGTHTVP